MRPDLSETPPLVLHRVRVTDYETFGLNIALDLNKKKVVQSPTRFAERISSKKSPLPRSRYDCPAEGFGYSDSPPPVRPDGRRFDRAPTWGETLTIIVSMFMLLALA